MVEELLDDGSVDYPGQYRGALEERKALVAKLRNHLHVMMTNALSAASDTHTSMCLSNEDNPTLQGNLSTALHSNLIAAGVARQALDDLREAR